MPARDATATQDHARRIDRFVADVLAVWPDNAIAAWSETLVVRLIAYRPEEYAHWDAVRFGMEIRSAGVDTMNLKLRGVVRRGIRLRDLRTNVRVHDQVIYFAERHGFLKIGTTKNITARIAAIDRGAQAIAGMTLNPVNLLATMPGGGETERALHRLFADLRYEGEWFLFDEPLIAFVRAVAAVGFTP